MAEGKSPLPNQLCSFLQKQLDQLEQQMANSMEMRLHKCNEGFTQEEIYSLCGRNDEVATITLREGSASETKYGHDITLCFYYTQKERQSLENNISSLNANSKVKAKALLPDYDVEKAELLLKEGIDTKDIVELLVVPSTPKANLYYEKEQRDVRTLKVPFKAEGGGRDIFWMYGALKHFLNDGISLAPEEMAEYYAYKLVLEPETFTEGERRLVFNQDGKISNKEVIIKYLSWKEEAHKLGEQEKIILARLRYNQILERLGKLDKELSGVGGLLNFSKVFPTKADLLINKVLRFIEHHYNVVGRHLLYMDLDSFIHIYLRHVEELKNNQIYGERTKFQLREEDVETVIGHVLEDLNDEYQLFKDEHPDWDFRKYADQAYYYNGDYYALTIDSNGRLVTFYKLGEGK